MMPAKSNWLAISCILFVATMWGIYWYPLRLFEQNGLHGLWLTLTLYSAPALLVGSFYLKATYQAWKKHPLPFLVMALAAGWCNVAFILAVIDGNVMRVLLLFYLSPVWALLLAHFLLEEKLTIDIMLVLIIAISGAFVMLWSEHSMIPYPRDHIDWLALTAGFSFALSNVMARKLHESRHRTKTVTSWYGVVLVSILVIVFHNPQIPAVSLDIWGGAFLFGFMTMTLMTIALIYGVSHLPVSQSAILLLFELVAGALSSYLLAGEVMKMTEWMGGVLIIVAAYRSSTIQKDEVLV